MKNKTKSIRLPNNMINVLRKARKQLGHTIPCMIRKAINAAHKHNVVWSNHIVSTTSNDSMAIKCNLTLEQAELPGKVIAAYVNWYLQQNMQTINEHKPFVPEYKGDYIIEVNNG